MSFPNEYLYTHDHEWAQIQDEIATVGITQHAQEALGEIVFVELPEVGKILQRGDTFGVVESIKAVSDLYSPLSGKVVEINSEVVDNPGVINDDPHGASWFIKIKLDKPEEQSELLDAKAYEELVASL